MRCRLDADDAVDDAVEELAVVEITSSVPGRRAASPRARPPRRGPDGWSARRAAAGRSGTSAPAPARGARASRRRTRRPAASIAAASKPSPSSRRAARAARRVAVDRLAAARAARRAERRRRRLGGREPASTARSSRSPSCTKSTAGARVGVDLLRDVAMHVSRRGSSISPASGAELAADQREQARLAGAVRADDADLVAAEYAEVRPSNSGWGPRRSVSSRGSASGCPANCRGVTGSGRARRVSRRRAAGARRSGRCAGRAAARTGARAAPRPPWLAEQAPLGIEAAVLAQELELRRRSRRPRR